MDFAIFRVGEKKFKSINQIKGYQRHMNREMQVFNADPNSENVPLIDNGDITKDAENYIQNIKLRKNAVLARELLLTASPEWFKDKTQATIDKWVDVNVKWLREEFGDNIRHLVLHRDETTLHMHGLVIPRFKDNKRDRYVLANSRYFDGRQKLSEYQDRYSESMKELGLERGIKWSKAHHTKIKTYYTLVNKELDTKDIEQVVAKAKNSELLEEKITELSSTLNSYKDYNSKSQEEKEQINNKYLEATKDKKLLTQCIKYMSDLYKIPQNHITKILKSMSNKEIDTDKDKGLERKRE